MRGQSHKDSLMTLPLVSGGQGQRRGGQQEEGCQTAGPGSVWRWTRAVDNAASPSMHSHVCAHTGPHEHTHSLTCVHTCDSNMPTGTCPAGVPRQAHGAGHACPPPRALGRVLKSIMAFTSWLFILSSK